METNTEQEINLDIEGNSKDKETVQEKELLPDGNYKYPDGSIRNKLGQLQAGSPPMYRGGGKKNRNRRLEKYLDMKIGDDGKRAIDHLLDIIEDRKNSNSHRIEAIKVVLSYQFGRPKQSIEKNETIDVSVEHRIAHVAKLLQQNKKIVSNVEVIDIDVDDIREIENDGD